MPDTIHAYMAYGLTISSELPVLEFTSIEQQVHYDVSIRLLPPAVPAPQLVDKHYHFDVKKQDGLLYFKDVGTFHLPDPGTITVEPVPGVDLRMLALFLSNIIFAVLFYLRGLLVYHGSVVALDQQRAIALVGESGAGKSSLAALLHNRGHTCLADDVAVVTPLTNRITVMPAFPMLKLDRRIADLLHLSWEQLQEVHPSEDKRYLALAPDPFKSAYTLEAVFIVTEGSDLSLSKLSPRAFMLENLRYTVPTRLLQQTGDTDHFHRCADIARRIAGFKLTRTDNIEDRTALVESVLTACC